MDGLRHLGSTIPAQRPPLPPPLPARAEAPPPLRGDGVERGFAVPAGAEWRGAMPPALPAPRPAQEATIPAARPDAFRQAVAQLDDPLLGSVQVGHNGSLVILDDVRPFTHPDPPPAVNIHAAPKRWGALERLGARLKGWFGAGKKETPAPPPLPPPLPTAPPASPSSVRRISVNDLKHEPDLASSLLMDPVAKVVSSKRLGSGINASVKVRLSNGVDGVWKPTDGENMEKLRVKCEEDHQGRREAATYIVDRYMGHFGGVPPVVYRTIDDKPGTLMLWATDAYIAYGNPQGTKILADPSTRSYQRLAVLDNVIGNLDRHEGNWMIDDAGEAIPIDHGLAFPHDNGKQGFMNYDFSHQVPLSPEARGALEHLAANREACSEELRPLLDEKAIKSMFERVDRMLELGRTYHEWRQ